MLPSWFAEYTLYLGAAAILLGLGFTVLGWVAASKGSFSDLLSDASRTRRPTAVIAAVGCLVGFVLGAFAFFSDLHLRLALTGFATTSLISAVAAAAGLPIRRFWTNEYWGLPPVDTMTPEEARALARTIGQVYAVSGLACVIAVIGSLIGIIPNLAYVGEAPIPAIFVLGDVAAILVGAALAFKAWQRFQSVRVHRAAAP